MMMIVTSTTIKILTIIIMININLIQSQSTAGLKLVSNTLHYNLNWLSEVPSSFLPRPILRNNFPGYGRKILTSKCDSYSHFPSSSIRPVSSQFARLQSSQSSVTQTLGDYDIDIEEIREM